MNKLINNINGGFDFKSDDLRWLQDSTFEAIKGVLSPFIANNDVTIISGCIISFNLQLNTYVVSEGFVSYNKEIMHVPYHTIISDNKESLYWKLDVIYDSNGLKTTKNNQSHDSYEIRKMKLVFSLTDTNQIQSLASTKNIYQVIKEEIANVNNPEWTELNLNSFNQKFKVFRTVDGIIHLKGLFTADIYSPVIELGVLPSDFRPQEELTFPYTLYTQSGVLKRTIIKITPDGKIIYNGEDPSTPGLDPAFEINLHLIPPFRIF